MAPKLAATDTPIEEEKVDRDCAACKRESAKRSAGLGSARCEQQRRETAEAASWLVVISHRQVSTVLLRAE